MEQLDLTTPEIYPAPAAATSYWKIASVFLNWAGASVIVGLVGQNGEKKHVEYSGDLATIMMVALNKANLSTKSLQRRILERLMADGHLAGTISGTAD
jgi:hypothetical protein